MTQFNGIRTVLVAVAFVILLAPVVSVAQGFRDRDAREISGYVLTEAAVAKYTRAITKLGDLAKSLSGGCDDEAEGSGSLDESVTRINAVPGAQAAIKSAGMTTREYVVFTWSLFQSGMAAWALSQPGGTLPSGVSRANVDFYRAHEQALQKLGPQQGTDACSERDEADQETEGAESEEPTE